MAVFFCERTEKSVSREDRTPQPRNHPRGLAEIDQRRQPTTQRPDASEPNHRSVHNFTNNLRFNPRDVIYGHPLPKKFVWLECYQSKNRKLCLQRYVPFYRTQAFTLLSLFIFDATFTDIWTVLESWVCGTDSFTKKTAFWWKKPT